jgi:hypothetical protein
MGRKFIIHIITSIAIAVIASSAYFYWVCHSLRHTREFFPGRLNSVLYDTTRYDAVFMGTSRTSKLIDPLIFDSMTGLKSFNAGMEGASYGVIELFTKKFISNHHPKYVFINLDIYTLEKDNSLFDYPQYYPHMSDPDIAALSKRKPELLLGKYAPFLAISYLDDYLKGVAFDEVIGRQPTDDQTYVHHGFSPIDTSYAYCGTDAEVALSFSYDTANLKKLDALCQYCTTQGCQVVFVMAPMYATHRNRAANEIDFYTRLGGISSKYRVRKIDFYTDRSYPKDMYFNRTHLNSKGAAVYSQRIAEQFARAMDIDSTRN